jgi:hypothetical protein
MTEGWDSNRGEDSCKEFNKKNLRFQTKTKSHSRTIPRFYPAHTNTKTPQGNRLLKSSKKYCAMYLRNEFLKLLAQQAKKARCNVLLDLPHFFFLSFLLRSKGKQKKEPIHKYA